MSSPESSLSEFAHNPDADREGGSRDAVENPHLLDFLSKEPLYEPRQDTTDQLCLLASNAYEQGDKDRYSVSEQRRCSVENCTSEVSNYSKVPDNFVWTEALSPNAQKLWMCLLGEGGTPGFLKWRASEEGWNLDAAIDELEDHKVLDRSCPGRLRIVKQYRGYD